MGAVTEMSHDLRQALGFRSLPSSDPVEQKLREQWYESKTAAEGKPDGSPEGQLFRLVNKKLMDYLWDRVSTAVAADRAKHPKARRNLPVGSMRGLGEGKNETPVIKGYTK